MKETNGNQASKRFVDGSEEELRSKCASGERHQAYLYMYRKNGKTCSMHVPKYAVEDFRKMLAKGIKAEEELVQNGIDFLKSLRGCAKGRK